MIKVFPCIVVWIAVIVELMTFRKQPEQEKETNIPVFH
jgi:hypothetical protein